jgi:hypothetical protein
MAILDFLNKNKEDKPSDTDKFTPKSEVTRGPGGKFVSKKKTEAKTVDHKPEVEHKHEAEHKTEVDHKHEAEKDKFYGPFMIPAAGKEARKYYANKKWYFAIEDLACLLSADPPIKPINELRSDPKFKDLFEKHVKTIDGVDCSDIKGISEILRLIIKTYDATFPGSLFSWLEDISTHEFVKPQTKNEK